MTDMDLDAVLSGLQHPEDEPTWKRMSSEEKIVAVKISELARVAQQEIARLKAENKTLKHGAEIAAANGICPTCGNQKT